MEAASEVRKLRVVSGTPAEVEYELNRLLKDYISMMWNFSEVNGRLIVSVVLIAQSEVRMQQMMAAGRGRMQ